MLLLFQSLLPFPNQTLPQISEPNGIKQSSLSKLVDVSRDYKRTNRVFLLKKPKPNIQTKKKLEASQLN